jgi:predicted nucleic acid-binding protein
LRGQGFFYDTWALAALANRSDPAHDDCAAADEALENAGLVAITSDYILDETITLLHSAAGFRVAALFLDLMTTRIEAGEVLLVTIHPERRERSFQVFRRLGKETPRLSFTDCTSFVVMRELGLRLAFTADRHFHRAGGGVRPLFEWQRGRLEFRL